MREIQNCVTVFVIIVSICARFADAKGKARVSYTLAQVVCTSAVEFATTNQIQPPFKSPPFNDDLCKTLTWSNCVPKTATGVCQKFKLKNCRSQSPPENNLNKASEKMTRIVQGMDAKPNEFPHLVRITLNRKQHCGGTILNENYIVTAGHCVYEYFYPVVQPGNKFEIIAGEHSVNNSDGTEQFRNIKKPIWHENFVLNNTHVALNDIALLLLDEPLEFNEHVSPPKFPQSDYEVTGKLGTMAGWGQLKLNGNYPDILQKVNLSILSDAVCADAWYRGEFIIVPETVVCATSDEKGKNKNTCFADSGGPLTVKVDNDCYDDNNNGATTNYLFVGIASYNAFCGGHLPSVYTQVSKYIDWINIHTV